MNVLRLGQRSMMVLAAAAVMSALAAWASGDPEGATLAVRDGNRWVTWWKADTAPARWSGDAPLAHRIAWRPGSSGTEWGELALRGSGEAWRTRVIVVRFDPERLHLALAPAFIGQKSWTVEDADTAAVLALVAGQFRHTLPYGWVVTGGHELLPAEYAPLAGAVIVDSSGTIRIVSPDSVADERERGTAREAFQSYPMLLEGGRVPAALRRAGLGVNIAHRDARLALGTLSDGRVVVALTRFDALTGSLGRIPFGLTSREMAAVMGGLGCRDAIMLDGGISAQLLVRDAGRSKHVWPGLRSVPLALVGSRQSPVSSRQLPATSHQLPATSRQSP